MRFNGIIYVFVCIWSFIPVSAQIKVIPRDRLEAVANPAHSSDSAFLKFDTKHIRADFMDENDSPKKFVYTFTNTGKRMLEIKRLVTTCSCASAVAEPVSVPAGGTCRVTVTYNPKGHPGRFERKVFVYTGDGNSPAAVLRLSVDVSDGTDLSKEWPVRMGPVRLRSSEVTFTGDVMAVETIGFTNVGDRPVELQCEKAFLPECLEFSTDPVEVEPGAEGQIRISYDPSRPGAREVMKVILKDLNLPPSKSTITVNLNIKNKI